MKKYLFLVGVLLAGSSLQAAERLTFKSVLSRAVGSFWSLQTTTCAYPDIAGTAGDASNQAVVNFGPTQRGGNIHLYGGPMKVDTLLMEDGSSLNTGSDVPFLFVQPDAGDAGGKLSIFRNGSVYTKALLVNNLILPRNTYTTYLNVSDTLKINWPELKVADISLSDLGDHFSVSNNSAISGESGAYFHQLAKSNDPSGEDQPIQNGFRYYMYKD